MARGARYLTAAEKAGAIEGWFGVLHDHSWQPADGPGDRGEPDADMVPWCIRLNRLRGICTLQSCAGHRDGDVLSSGHVWLRLDRRANREFEKDAHGLANSEGVEQVSRLYRADGQTVVVVTFQGNERGVAAAPSPKNAPGKALGERIGESSFDVLDGQPGTSAVVRIA